MSIKVCLDNLSEELKTNIARNLQFTPKETKYGPSDKVVCAFDIEDNDVYLPLYFAQKSLKLERRSRKDFPQLKLKFSGKLRPLQQEVKKEALRKLNKKGTTIISLFTGGGKTITAINITLTIKMPVLIIVSRVILIDQWEESIKKFCDGAVIQKVKPKTKIDKNAHFYIINAINVPKLPRDTFNHVGTLVVDELHLIGTEKLSNSLHYVSPRYAIGLSATPSRPDGMDNLLFAYFGSDIIFRKLHRKHLVYRVKTNFVPTVEQTRMGKLDWNSVLNSQAESDERNDKIVKIIEHFSDRCFLVLCKRVSHVQTIVEKLKAKNIDVTSLVGMKKEFDTTSRVLIATVQKAGVGFNHPKLDALIVAADLQEYFIQYLGRVFRTEDGVPVIFDLVDKFSVLERHYRQRRLVYLEHGGTIKNFQTTFPNFFVN